MEKLDQFYNNNNSKIGFENFLLSIKLDDLLKLATTETDSNKIQKIKKIINLKVNYLNENNQKIYGIELARHKKKILKKYKKTEYEQFISINSKNGDYKIKTIFSFFIILFLFIYIQKNSIKNYYYYHIKSYEYDNNIIKYEDLNKILIIKTRLGDLYQEKNNLEKSYETYVESYNIYNNLNRPETLKELEEKYLDTRKNLYISLENRIIEIQNNLEEDAYKLKKELESVYNATKNTDLYKTQGKALELQGDLLLKTQGSLIGVKNYYISALKFYKKDKDYPLNEIKLKIKSVEDLFIIKKLLNDAKILQLKNETDKANLKYNKIKQIYNNLDLKYQIFNLDKNIERKT